MIRRTARTALGQRAVEAEDPSPLETVANLSDVMLVLAVALMLALLTRTGMDISAFQLDASNLEPIDTEEMETGQSTTSSGDGDYVEVGKVYRNSDGEMFMLGE